MSKAKTRTRMVYVKRKRRKKRFFSFPLSTGIPMLFIGAEVIRLHQLGNNWATTLRTASQNLTGVNLETGAWNLGQAKWGKTLLIGGGIGYAARKLGVNRMLQGVPFIKI